MRAPFDWRLECRMRGTGDVYSHLYQLKTTLGSMRAEVHSTLDGSKVAVVFAANPGPSGSNAYARAEAARLLAQILDTIGDGEMTPNEPFNLELPQLVDHKVMITGADALTVVATYFGDKIAELIL